MKRENYRKHISLTQLFMLILISLFLCSDFSHAQSQGFQPQEKAAVYRISVHPDTPALLNASLTLPEPVRNGGALLYTKGMALNVEPQIINVNCNGQLVRRNENSQWLIPAGCREIFWEIELVTSEPFSLEISRQQSVLVRSDPPWILLSGFSFMPGIDNEGHKSVIEFGPVLEKQLVSLLSRDENNRRILPNGNGGPVFLVFGLKPLVHNSPSGFHLSYLVDDKEAEKEIETFYPSHIKSIEYLRSLFTYPADREFSFNVVWLGLNRKGGLGGAAGYRAFLINYPCENGKLMKDKFIWALMTAFHEQFHVLYPSGGHQPTWVNESLAQYYAIKSLEKAGFDQGLLKSIKDQFFHPERKIGMGLIEANRKFKYENDFSVYSLFYDQGSTFWFELDNLISDSTEGKKSLDNFIDQFSGMTFPEDGRIPTDFIDVLNANNIDGIESLVEKYL